MGQSYFGCKTRFCCRMGTKFKILRGTYFILSSRSTDIVVVIFFEKRCKIVTHGYMVHTLDPSRHLLHTARRYLLNLLIISFRRHFLEISHSRKKLLTYDRRQPTDGFETSVFIQNGFWNYTLIIIEAADLLTPTISHQAIWDMKY